jgi:peptidoglycan hydrolase CwlO-like protein
MTFEEYQEQINNNLAQITANQVRFDNGLQALLEAQANHETLIQELHKGHEEHAVMLAEIKNTNSLLARVVLDHEDRLNNLDGGQAA